MEPAQCKVAHHEIHPRDTTPPPHAVQLSLIIQAPNAVEVLGYIRTSERPDELFDIAVTGSADHDVRRELRAVLEYDAILREVRDLRVILKPDLAVYDELTAANI